MKQLKTHGIKESNQINDKYSLIEEEIKIKGFSVVDSGFKEEYLELLREKIDIIYKKQEEEIGGGKNLGLINDANVARQLLAYDNEFLKLLDHDIVLEISKRFLGDFFVLMSQNALINRSDNNHYQTTWHRDLNYQHFVSSRMLALSVLYCIDDFSEKTGGTYVLPSTHLVEKFPSDQYVLRNEQVVSAKAGSIILFDAMLFHRAGDNYSGKTRRAVNHIITVPMIIQQISFPKMLGDDFQCRDEIKRILGYYSQIPDNVCSWRLNKLNNKKND